MNNENLEASSICLKIGFNIMKTSYKTSVFGEVHNINIIILFRHLFLIFVPMRFNQ